MGKRGPAKTPTAELKLRGSWRANERINEPVFDDGVPECPDWLRPEAKEAWDDVVPKLAAVPGLLKAIDENALVVYCQTWAKWRECEDFLEKHGDVYAAKNAKGKVTGFVQHPQVNTAIKLDAALFAMEKQFGLTPSARAGLSVSDIPPQSPADAASELIRVALARAN